MLEDTFNYNQNVAAQAAGQHVPRSESDPNGEQYSTVQFSTAGSNVGGGAAPNFAPNYAMQQGIQQNPAAAAAFPGDFGMYRSSYLHSHAKPPYSYISLIAMAIQVNKLSLII